jgi:excisionase family DNA binding protein
LSSEYPGAADLRAALLSVRQVAQLLGVSTAIVYRLCERGELANYRVAHAIRVSRSDLTAYLDRQRDG